MRAKRPIQSAASWFSATTPVLNTMPKYSFKIRTASVGAHHPSIKMTQKVTPIYDVGKYESVRKERKDDGLTMDD